MLTDLFDRDTFENIRKDLQNEMPREEEEAEEDGKNYEK